MIKRRQQSPRGIALILVLLAMAVVAVLAYAMLSASALQATASSNAVTAAQAQAMAESGIHLASYYLAHPQSTAIGSELAVSGAVWGPTNVTFASMPAGSSATVTVTSLGDNCYTVQSVGTAGTGSSISRTITAELEVEPSYQITGAGELNCGATLNSDVTVNGSGGNSLVSSGTVAQNGASLTPAAISDASSSPAPASDTITDFSQPYYYDGTLYYPQSISSGGTYAPGPTNPLGIFYHSGSLIVTTALTVTGTLEIESGELETSSNVTVNPVSTATYSLPALVIGQSLEIIGSNKTIAITGVVSTATGIAVTGSHDTITINGGMLVTGSTANAISTGTTSQFTLTYNSSYTNVLNLVTSEPPAIKVISWVEGN